MAKAMDVADEIITIAKEEGKPVSNLMLQKVMYFLNALSLVNREKPLIDDGQHFEKWTYGPVIHSVYTEYASNGANPIQAPIEHQIVELDNQGFFKIEKTKFNSDDFQKKYENDYNFIIKNINTFLSFTSSFLVGKSHEEPQWTDRTKLNYDDKLTKNYYSNFNNQFWS